MFRRIPPPKNFGWLLIGIFATGMLITYNGWALLQGGIFAYYNHHRAEVYSPEVIVLGVVFMLLAIVPNSLVARMVKGVKPGLWLLLGEAMPTIQTLGCKQLNEVRVRGPNQFTSGSSPDGENGANRAA